MASKRHTSDVVTASLPVDTPQFRKKLPENWDFPIFVKTFRIAVSGDVLVTQLELDIINTPDFQRLQGVRQLGASVRVYPTALHTRFDHSLGTLGMVDKMIAEIRDDNNKYNKQHPGECQITDDERALARLYALLHDVTHVPFGHTIEDELGIFTKHDSPKSPRFDRFLSKESDIGKAIRSHLSEDGYERFSKIFKNQISETEDFFIYDLVSNTVCADLLDYALRDSYFCNLDIDMEYRFLKYLYLKEVKERKAEKDKKHIKGGRRVLIRLWKGDKNKPRRDTLTDLTRLLETRYMIAERVYFHHAKIIAGTMITRAIQEANLNDILSDDDLCGHTDDTLVRFLIEDDRVGEVGQRLALAYKDRKLYKTIREYTESDFLQHQSQDHTVSLMDNIIDRLVEKNQRRDAENEIAEDINARPGDILIYPPPEKSMNNKVAEMLVQWEGKVQMFQDIDDDMVTGRLQAILTAHRKLWKVCLIGDRKLTDVQRDLAKHAFEAKFLNVGKSNEATKKRLENIETLVRHHVATRTDLEAITPKEHSRLVKETADHYLTVGRGKRGKRLSIKDAVNFVWKNKKSGGQ